MDGKNGLVAVGAYLTVTATILVAAAWTVFNLGVDAPAVPVLLEPSANSLQIADTGPVAQLELPPSPAAQKTTEQRRMLVLEKLLDEKNRQLQELARQLDRTQAELNDLQRQYDEAIGTTLLESDPPAERAIANDNTGDARAQELDPLRLEAELSMAEAVQRQLLADLQALRTQLEQANSQVTDLQARLQRESASAMDQLELEAATTELVREIGATAVPALVQALEHRNPLVRRWAAETLGRLGPDAGSAVAALTEALADGDRNVRNAARSALESIER